MTHEDLTLHNEAIGVENAIAIGSCHLSGSHLHMLYGDGDKYSAYSHVEEATHMQGKGTKSGSFTRALSICSITF